MRRRYLLLAVAIIALLAVVVAFLINQEYFFRLIYPESTLKEDSNLTVKGIVASIEENHITRGMVYSNHHVFRFYIQLNITEVVWTSEDYLNSSVGGETVFGSNIISVGYDTPDNPQLTIGQDIECKGFYLGATDSCFSFVLTVGPSIHDSYLSAKLDVFLK